MTNVSENKNKLKELIETHKIGNTGKTMAEMMKLYPEKEPEQGNLDIVKEVFDKELVDML